MVTAEKQKSGPFFTFYFLLFTFYFSAPVAAQTIAFLTPDKTAASEAFADKLVDFIDTRLKVLDRTLAEAAYRSVSPATPFNLTVEESKRIGTVIGCDYFVLVRATTQRRSAFQPL